jgi:hypothetical protein
LDGTLSAGCSTTLLFAVVQRAWKDIWCGHAATSAGKNVPNVIDS